MYANTEQFAAAGKAGLDSLVHAASTGFAGFEKLVALNVSSTKALFADLQQTATAALDAKDPKELLALNSGAAQPALEKSLAYSKELFGIFSGTQQALRAAVEEQSATLQKEFTTVLDKALKSAPPGSESAVAALRSAISAATSAYDNAAKVAKQAFDTAEANFTSAASTAAANVTAATKAGARRK
jgi:phasin family protein